MEAGASPVHSPLNCTQLRLARLAFPHMQFSFLFFFFHFSSSDIKHAGRVHLWYLLWHEMLQLTVDYTGIGDTSWGADIHTIERCDFTMIYFERWDHEENMSVSLRGSNPPFSGVRVLLSSQCICHNWHKKQGWVCHKLCYRSSALQIAVNFMSPKMNVRTIFCEWT